MIRLCQCGCGRATALSQITNKNKGIRKGQSNRFIKGHSIQGTPVAERFWRKVNKDGPVPAHRPELGPCWVWTDHLSSGYGMIRLESTKKGDKGQNVLCHRLAWFLETGTWPEPCALHKCDNRACVRFDHLFEGDRADNIRDMASKNRGRSWLAKLLPADVIDIRNRLAA